MSVAPQGPATPNQAPAPASAEIQTPMSDVATQQLAVDALTETYGNDLTVRRSEKSGGGLDSGWRPFVMPEDLHPTEEGKVWLVKPSIDDDGKPDYKLKKLRIDRVAALQDEVAASGLDADTVPRAVLDAALSEEGTGDPAEDSTESAEVDSEPDSVEAESEPTEKEPSQLEAEFSEIEQAFQDVAYKYQGLAEQSDSMSRRANESVADFKDRVGQSLNRVSRALYDAKSHAGSMRNAANFINRLNYEAPGEQVTQHDIQDLNNMIQEMHDTMQALLSLQEGVGDSVREGASAQDTLQTTLMSEVGAFSQASELVVSQGFATEIDNGIATAAAKLDGVVREQPAESEGSDSLQEDGEHIEKLALLKIDGMSEGNKVTGEVENTEAAIRSIGLNRLEMVRSAMQEAGIHEHVILDIRDNIFALARATEQATMLGSRPVTREQFATEIGFGVSAKINQLAQEVERMRDPDIDVSEGSQLLRRVLEAQEDLANTTHSASMNVGRIANEAERV